MCIVPDEYLAELGEVIWYTGLNGFILVSNAGEIIAANEPACRILNANLADLIGIQWRGCVSENVFLLIRANAPLKLKQGIKSFPLVADWRISSDKHVGVILNVTPLKSVGVSGEGMPPLLLEVVIAPDTLFSSLWQSCVNFLMRYGKILAGIGATLAGGIGYALKESLR